MMIFLPLIVSASNEIDDHVRELNSIWNAPLFYASMHPNTRRTLINHFCVSEENQPRVIIFVEPLSQT